MLKIKKTIAILLVISFGIACIIFQKSVQSSIINAIDRCIYTLIPSLFATTVFSSVIAKNGVFAKLSFLFPTKAEISQAFIFSNIGGYPIGAKMLKDSVDSGKLSRKEASEALCFCYASGPAFSVGIIGEAFFSSTYVGFCVFITIFLVNLTLYIIYAIKNRCKGIQPYKNINFSTSDIVDSVEDASRSMVKICSMVLLFAAIQGVIDSMITYDKLFYFTPLLDITNISDVKNIGFEAACVYLSFGGTCVIMQLCAIIGNGFSMKPFFVMLLVRLPLTCLFAYLINLLIERYALEAFAKFSFSQSKSVVPLVCMLAMILIALSKKEKRPNASSA